MFAYTIDVEVFGVIRRDFLLGRLDPTAAHQAALSHMHALTADSQKLADALPGQ